jgi:hypothetical protein
MGVPQLTNYVTPAQVLPLVCLLSPTRLRLTLLVFVLVLLVVAVELRCDYLAGEM